MPTSLRRRTFLGGVALAGGLSVTDTPSAAAEQTDCSPGHAASDPPCEQVDDDADVLTGFDAAGTPVAVTFDYPCGWRTNTIDQFEDRSQVTVTRDDFDAYAAVQVRTYYEPVEAGFIDETRGSGDFVDVEYTVAGESRTGLVTSRETARFGTVGHAVLPVGNSRVHVELVSTLKGTECSQPRPDYDLVREMLRSLEVNRRSTFPEQSGRVDEYGVARIDPRRIEFDEATGRVEVPPTGNVSLPGITNLAPGTNLMVQVNSKAGEETSFFDLQEGIQPRAATERDWQLWSITTQAFAGAEPGTEFEIEIRLDGTNGTINPGEFVEGVVVEAPTVETLEFTDKTSTGDVVVVDRVEASDGGVVVLEDADGTELGRSSHLAGGQVHEDVPVSLDAGLEAGSHAITATILRPTGDPYPAIDARTATITVGDAATTPGVFRVTDLQSDPATLDDLAETLTVTATIENTGDRRASADVAVALAGSVQSTKSVSLDPGAETTVAFQLDTSGLEVGESAVFRVSTTDDSVSGTLSVDERPESRNGSTAAGDGDGAGGETGTDGGGPGLGVGGALVSVLATAGLARWKSQQD